MNWKDLDRAERIEKADEVAAAIKTTGSLGERIKIIRCIYDMKQAEFAQSLGVSRSYLSEVENEKGKPSIEMVVGIASMFFYVNKNWLLTGDGNVHIPIEYDDHGWSILPVHHIDYGALLSVMRVIETYFGEDWLSRQSGARRKADILAYFYDMHVSAYQKAAAAGAGPPRKCRELAESACLEVIERAGELGLPSVRHRPLEE